MFKRIGVGYNGTPDSERALELARRIAAGTGARLSAFEAVSLSRSRFEARLFRLREAVDTLVTEAMERIRALGGVEAHVAYGDAAEELALYSASLDLLVVGSRGFGPIGRLIHGSTSGKLTRMARCPLLVLSRSAPVIAAGDAEGTRREPAVVAKGCAAPRRRPRMSCGLAGFSGRSRNGRSCPAESPLRARWSWAA